jgi:hypothetical protein
MNDHYLTTDTILGPEGGRCTQVSLHGVVVVFYLRPFHLVEDCVTVIEEHLAILLLVGLPKHHSANA